MGPRCATLRPPLNEKCEGDQGDYGRCNEPENKIEAQITLRGAGAFLLTSRQRRPGKHGAQRQTCNKCSRGEGMDEQNGTWLHWDLTLDMSVGAKGAKRPL